MRRIPTRTARRSLAPLLAMAALTAMGALLALAAVRPRRRRPRFRRPPFAAIPRRPAATAPERSDAGYVRPAGAAAAGSAREEWDAIDEASDESFPASDPPARY